jgi:hypothetical protein
VIFIKERLDDADGSRKQLPPFKQRLGTEQLEPLDIAGWYGDVDISE